MRVSNRLLWPLLCALTVGCSSSPRIGGYPSRKELRTYRSTGRLILPERAEGLTSDQPGAQPGAPLSQRLLAFLGRHPEDKVRRAAAHDLAHVSSTGTISALNETVQHDTAWKVRREAIRALAAVNSKESNEVLIQALRKDPRSGVREEAARALGRLRIKEAIPQLREAADYDSDWEVRLEADEALVRLDPAYRPRYSRYYGYPYWGYPYYQFYDHHYFGHHYYPYGRSHFSIGFGCGF